MSAMLAVGCASDTSKSTAATVPPGVAFTDPQGLYTVDIGSDWTESSEVTVNGVETWTLAPHEDGFTTNVNVLTQNTQGLDLAGYLQSSVVNIGAFHLIDGSTVAGANGNDLGVLEYTGVVPGVDGSLHFLAVIDVLDGQAIVATLTSKEESFAEARADAEPFLLTLQAT